MGAPPGRGDPGTGGEHPAPPQTASGSPNPPSRIFSRSSITTWRSFGGRRRGNSCGLSLPEPAGGRGGGLVPARFSSLTWTSTGPPRHPSSSRRAAPAGPRARRCTPAHSPPPRPYGRPPSASSRLHIAATAGSPPPFAEPRPRVNAFPPPPHPAPFREVPPPAKRPGAGGIPVCSPPQKRNSLSSVLGQSRTRGPPTIAGARFLRPSPHSGGWGEGVSLFFCIFVLCFPLPPVNTHTPLG